MSQHTNKKSGCALYLARQHVLFCHQENTYDGFEPDIVVISNMILDVTCPVTARDIVAQPTTWDPTQNFQNDGSHGHTVSDDLTQTNFHQLYQDYVNNHAHLQNIQIPDAVSMATETANTVQGLPRALTHCYRTVCEEHVQRKINAGRLQRVGNGAGNGGGNGA